MKMFHVLKSTLDKKSRYKTHSLCQIRWFVGAKSSTFFIQIRQKSSSKKFLAFSFHKVVAKT